LGFLCGFHSYSFFASIEGYVIADMSNNDWQTKFREAYDHSLVAWRAGRRSPKTILNAEDATFLASIGCTTQELLDFVEDAQNCGEPDFGTVLAVQAIRRDYFLTIMGGKLSGRVVLMDDLPAKTDAVEEIEWLPRIITKARLKLRGEMPADLMYGCGGDRAFLRRMKMSLPDFLKLVWESGEGGGQIIKVVKRSAGFA
jgi:hypothetical protein